MISEQFSRGSAFVEESKRDEDCWAQRRDVFKQPKCGHSVFHARLPHTQHVNMTRRVRRSTEYASISMMGECVMS